MITGATGAIGSALVPLFLREPETRVRLLIRAESDARLQERLGELLAFWQLDGAELIRSGRLQALRGDACLPRMGLPEAVFSGLAREITHLVDTVGDVKLNRPLEEARAHAMGAVRSAVELARAALSHGQFVKLDWVSTVGVAGRLPGLLREEPVTAPRGFHNTYEASKAEAENFLLAEMSRGLPATIHRPSMVVGDSVTGKVIRFQVFYHLCEFLSGRRTLGLVPNLGDYRLDIVPVDYVARAIHAASGRPETAGRIFHLCSGPELAAGLKPLSRAVRQIMTASGRKLPRLREVPRKWFSWTAPVVARLLPARPRKQLGTLPHFLAYLAERQAFDNSRTRLFLAARGVNLPVPENCLGAILGNYLDGRGPARQDRPLSP
jgi:thioester reductase-like protein